MNQNLSNPDSVSPFDRIRKMDENGLEYWEARELQEHLDYTEWRNFEKTIKKAMISCKVARQEISDHFVETNKMVSLGSGSQRSVIDYRLTKYACYLVAMNGDVEKERIALAQAYFAVQTHYAETVQKKSKGQEKERIFTQDVRRRCIANEKIIPDGYWCVVTEMWREAWALESFMKELQPSRLPDGSCGKKWRQYLRESNHPLLSQSYQFPLHAPHEQGLVGVNIYPMEVLPLFRSWLKREYAEYYDTTYSPSRVIGAPEKKRLRKGEEEKKQLPE